MLETERLRKTERLIQLWILLMHNPLRFTAKDLADRLNVNVRTVYRDLDTLQNINVPIWQDKNKWAIQEKYFLPPIRFTIPEAMTIFMAARLMLSYSHRYDPNMDTTFTKLSTVLQPPFREQVQKTLDWMRTLPWNQNYLRVLANLGEAWLSQRRVRITYQSLEAEEATERIIEPYFIEPAAEGHASYVIAYCHRSGEIRNFKIERIQDIRLTDEQYTIPAEFDANRYFGTAWGIVVEGKPQTIRLRFDPSIARIIKETVWHPSQSLNLGNDGSVVLTLRVSNTVELRSWILGWGEKVEVLEPKDLRREVARTARATAEVYKSKEGN